MKEGLASAGPFAYNEILIIEFQPEFKVEFNNLMTEFDNLMNQLNNELQR